MAHVHWRFTPVTAVSTYFALLVLPKLLRETPWYWGGMGGMAILLAILTSGVVSIARYKRYSLVLACWMLLLAINVLSPLSGDEGARTLILGLGCFALAVQAVRIYRARDSVQAS